MAEIDYYRVLQLDSSADAVVIDAAFRQLSKKYHPDVNPAPDAAQKMRELNAAHEVLGDPRKRAAYDRARRAAEAATWERRPTPPSPPTEEPRRPAPAPSEPPADEPRLVVTRRAIGLGRSA